MDKEMDKRRSQAGVGDPYSQYHTLSKRKEWREIGLGLDSRGTKAVRPYDGDNARLFLFAKAKRVGQNRRPPATFDAFGPGHQSLTVQSLHL